MWNKFSWQDSGREFNRDHSQYRHPTIGPEAARPKNTSEIYWLNYEGSTFNGNFSDQIYILSATGAPVNYTTPKN